MSWVLVAVGGSALVGAGASYLGSKKQAQGAERAQDINVDMFNRIMSQQQPFVSSGYGAMGRLNTLLGLNPNPRAQMPPRQFAPGQSFMPTPGGGVQPIMQLGPPQAPAHDVRIPTDPRREQVAMMRDLLRMRGGVR